MGAFLSVIGFLGFIVFFIMSIVSAFRKTRKGKQRLLFAGIFFIVMFIGGAITPTTKQISSSVTSNNGTAKQVATATDTKKNVETQTQSNQNSKETATTITKSVTPSASKSTATSATNNNQTSSAATSNLISAVVTKDVDGDTIKVSVNGNNETIRMLLIDTPEDVDPVKPVEPFAYQAADYAKGVLPVGKHIYLQIGKKGYEKDKYNRLLAYVYITPTDMYNKDVVKKGLARVAYIIPPNTDHLSDLQAAQNYAESNKLGIWSLAGYVTSNGYNLTESCAYAKSNGYSTKGCGSTTTKTTTSTHVVSKPSSSTTNSSTSTRAGANVTTSVAGSSLNVSHGDYASVSIKTKPGATGTIEVDYNSGPSKAAGLVTETADSSGNITWTWKVGTRTALGSYPVIITVSGTTITKTLTVN